MFSKIKTHLKIVAIALFVMLLSVSFGYMLGKKYDIEFRSPITINTADIEIIHATSEKPLSFEEKEDIFALLTSEITE